MRRARSHNKKLNMPNSRMKTSPPADPEPSRHVVLLDDNAALRESVKLLLGSVGLKTTAFQSPESFLQASLDEAGCVLLDIRMPEMSGIEVFRRLREQNIGTPVIFLTGHGDVAMAVKAMRNGAFDFLEKPVEDQHLIDTVLEAIRYDAERRLDDAKRKTTSSLLARLTARENEIARLIADGKSSREIAAVLALSVRTVEGYRGRIMAKLEVDSLAQLVRAISA